MMIRLIPLMMLLCGGVAQASHRDDCYNQDRERHERKANALRFDDPRFTTQAAHILPLSKQRFVRVRWAGRWYPAMIVHKSGPHYYVRYLGWSARWNEWVGRDRIRF